MAGKFIFVNIIYFVFIISITLGQESIKGKADFKVDVDIARFYGDSTQVYVEMYYGIRENIISYRLDSGKYIGKVYLSWYIRDNARIVSSKQWSVSHIIENPEKLAKPQTLLGLQSVGLPYGDYVFSLMCTDGNDSTRIDSFSTPLKVVPYPTGKECFSDIEFCTSIQSSSDKQSLFYKNTLEVIPNPSRLYGTGLPIMYFYTTIYNLLEGESRSNIFVHTAVIDAAGAEIITSEKSKSRLYNSSVEIGTVNLSAVKTGTYLFRLTLLDSTRTMLTAVEKRFFVFKYGSTPDSLASTFEADFSGSKYAAKSLQEIDQLFDRARYIASSFEKDQYGSLTDLKAKQKFLYGFWHRRDPDPVTPFNETEDAYYKRVDYANEQFTSGFRDGWKTDRGRVYIVYGPPEEIERFPNTSESNPYDIWHYHGLQGGVIFVFVDRDGLGNYVLVHSTHRDELRDEDWYKHDAQKTQ